MDFAKASKLKDTTLNEIKSLQMAHGSNLKDIEKNIAVLEKEADMKVSYQRGLRNDASSMDDANARFVAEIKEPFLEKFRDATLPLFKGIPIFSTQVCLN